MVNFLHQNRLFILNYFQTFDIKGAEAWISKYVYIKGVKDPTA